MPDAYKQTSKDLPSLRQLSNKNTFSRAKVMNSSHACIRFNLSNELGLKLKLIKKSSNFFTNSRNLISIDLF